MAFHMVSRGLVIHQGALAVDAAYMAGCAERIAHLDGVPHQVLSNVRKSTVLASFQFK
jgi:hypothetical protein